MDTESKAVNKQNDSKFKSMKKVLDNAATKMEVFELSKQIKGFASS